MSGEHLQYNYNNIMEYDNRNVGNSLLIAEQENDLLNQECPALQDNHRIFDNSYIMYILMIVSVVALVISLIATFIDEYIMKQAEGYEASRQAQQRVVRSNQYLNDADHTNNDAGTEAPAARIHDTNNPFEEISNRFGNYTETTFEEELVVLGNNSQLEDNEIDRDISLTEESARLRNTDYQKALNDLNETCI